MPPLFGQVMVRVTTTPAMPGSPASWTAWASASSPTRLQLAAPAPAHIQPGQQGGRRLAAPGAGLLDPRLGARHMPFPIGIPGRDQWVACMVQAMQEQGVEPALAARMGEALFNTADWMRNR